MVWYGMVYPSRGLGGTCITKNNTLSFRTSKRQCKNKNKKHIEKNKKTKKSGASSHLSHSPEGAWRDMHN